MEPARSNARPRMRWVSCVRRSIALMHDTDTFHDPVLHFTLTKPPSWRFMPAAWSPAAQQQNSAGSEIEWLQYAKLPFVCIMASHDSDDHTYPTVQVTARPSLVPDSAHAEGILSATIGFLQEQIIDFKLLDSSSEIVIAGCRANYVRSSFTVVSERGDEEKLFPSLGRLYTIFSPGIAFTLSMSSSADPAYFEEEEFREILGSIRIGPERQVARNELEAGKEAARVLKWERKK